MSREESVSIEEQERILRAKAQEMGLAVGDVHKDDGLSGALPIHKRPAFKSWTDDLREGRAGTLLVRDFARLSREGLRAAADVLELLDSTGGRLVSTLDGMDSDLPGFEMVAAVLSVQAKAERDAISARVSIRQAADRRAGRWTKPAPAGYIVQDARLVPGPDADMVRQMVADFLDGQSLRGIAGSLNARGVPASRGGPWGVSSVRHVLGSPTLCGHLPHGQSVVRDDDGAPVIVADEPLIDEATYARVVARLSERSQLGPTGRRVTAVGTERKSDLAGIVFCGAAGCGRPMTYQSRHGGRKSELRCAGRGSGHGCRAGAVPYIDVWEYVGFCAMQHVGRLSDNPDELRRIAERFLRSTLTPEDRAAEQAARAELEAVDAALRRLDDDRTDGLIDRERYAHQAERLSARRAAALAAIPAGVVDRTPMQDVEWIAQVIADGGKSSRRLLDLLDTRVVVHEGHGRMGFVGDRVSVWFAGVEFRREGTA